MNMKNLPHPIQYQGSKRNLAPVILRYFPKGFNRLVEPFAGSAAISIAADELNARKLQYIISYDGRRGDKTFGEYLPESLDMTRIEIEAGRSSQSTLLGLDEVTFESLYLSRALTEKLSSKPVNSYKPLVNPVAKMKYSENVEINRNIVIPF